MVFQVTEFKNAIDFLFVWWRDVMTSCHDVTKPDVNISACRSAIELILFLFPWFFRSLSSKMWMICNFVDVCASWRHVMTSRQYSSSPYSTYWSCSWAIVRFLYRFYANLSCWYQTNHRYWFCKLPPACHNVTSWHHDVTSYHRMKLKQC